MLKLQYSNEKIQHVDLLLVINIVHVCLHISEKLLMCYAADLLVFQGILYVSAKYY